MTILPLHQIFGTFCNLLPALNILSENENRSDQNQEPMTELSGPKMGKYAIAQNHPFPFHSNSLSVLGFMISTV